jgi:hypothetical protein
MPKPQNKDDLRRALGLINYLGKFVPNISESTKGFRVLGKDGQELMEMDGGSRQRVGQYS